jgi:hypothetical protein
MNADDHNLPRSSQSIRVTAVTDDIPIFWQALPEVIEIVPFGSILAFPTSILGKEHSTHEFDRPGQR